MRATSNKISPSEIKSLSNLSGITNREIQLTSDEESPFKEANQPDKADDKDKADLKGCHENSKQTETEPNLPESRPRRQSVAKT